MKITKSKLKQIILEEIQQDKEMLEAIEKLTGSIDNLDVSIDFLASAFTGESGVSIGAAQRQLGRAYRPKTRPMPEPVKESEQFRDQQKMDAAQGVSGQEMSFEKWIAVVFQKGAQIDDNSPNPYDAWMSGQSPEEYAGGLREGLFAGGFDPSNKKSPKPGKKPERTDDEKARLNRFLKKTGGKQIDETLNEALLNNMEREELFALLSKLPQPVAEKMFNLYMGVERGVKKVFDPGPHSPSEEFRKKNKDPFDRVSRSLDVSKFDDEITKLNKMRERKLSKGEEKEKERVVKGMKKSKKDFKKRYGDDAESVMYATATKIAKDKK